jgi:heat shock protein HslJ
MKHSSAIARAVLCVLLLAGCSARPDSAGTDRPAAIETRIDSLAGTRWRATAVDDGSGAAAAIDASLQVTLAFSADGRRASGIAGCNRYAAEVTVDGAALSFGAAAASKKMCGEPADVMAVEQRFLAALATVASARIAQDRLELRTAGGGLALALARDGAP